MAVDTDHARVESRQMPIFPRASQAVCGEINLTARDARRLHHDGLLSFDPESDLPLDESREAELVFLGSIIASGCSHAALRHLVTGLRKPYCYDLRRVFYEWRTRRWCLLPGEDDPEGAFFAMLERLRDRHAHDALLNLRSWLDEAIDLADSRALMFSHVVRGADAIRRVD